MRLVNDKVNTLGLSASTKADQGKMDNLFPIQSSMKTK